MFASCTFTLDEKIRYDIPLTQNELCQMKDERDALKIEVASLRSRVADLQTEVDELWHSLCAERNRARGKEK
jgi:predicted  nucleic acid-binding Zn-ribbon protein